jgi:hypothetical protein
VQKISNRSAHENFQEISPPMSQITGDSRDAQKQGIASCWTLADRVMI